MYLYVERFKAKLEETLNEMSVTDTRMREWFRTTFVTCMSKIDNHLRTCYLGTKAAGDTNTNIFTWAEAAEGMKQAVMNGEPIRELTEGCVTQRALNAIVRAMEQLSSERPDLKSFSMWDLDALRRQGELLIKQDYRRLMHKEAQEGMRVMYTAPDETYVVVGLFNHGALDYIGHDLLNCLRDEFKDRNSYHFDKPITHFGLKIGDKFVSIAEVQFHECLTDKSFVITSHKAVSNHDPAQEYRVMMHRALTAIYGTDKTGQLHGTFEKKVFRLKDGVPTLTVKEQIKGRPITDRFGMRGGLIRFLDEALLYPHQRVAMDTLREQFVTLGRRVGQRGSFIMDSLAMLYGADGQLRPIRDTQPDPLVDVTRPPELRGKRQRRDLEMLKHRTGQRNMTERNVPKLLASMQKRLTEQVFERTGSNVMLTPRETRIGSSESAGLVGIDPASSEGDRQNRTGSVGPSLSRGIRRGELFVIGAPTGRGRTLFGDIHLSRYGTRP